MNRNTAALESQEFAAGATIFEAGDEATSAFIIESGRVAVIQGQGDQARLINRLGPGDLFGEVALLDGGTRSATVRALETTRLLRIDRLHLHGILEQVDPVVRHLIRVLLEHVRRAEPPLPQVKGMSWPSLGLMVAAAEADEALHQQAIRTLTLAQSLAQAVAERQFELHYQPIVHLARQTPVGYEALIRWRHPTLGLIRPDEFIPLAEKTGLIHGIGEFVLQQAMDDWPRLRDLNRDIPRPPFVSVNLSAPEFCRPGIYELIAEGLKQRHMPPQALRIELTETVIIGNRSLALDLMERLRGLGVGIALDDFGKGYGGLDYLQALPFSCIKIDKSFVDRMQESDRSREIIQSTLGLAARLQMDTVAEGIEDEFTAAQLRDMHCEFGQGYLFSRPLPLPSLEATPRFGFA